MRTREPAMMQKSGSQKQTRWFTQLLILTLFVSLLLTPSVAQAATAVSGPVVVRPGGAQLYDAPDGEVVATLRTGTIFIASGRTEDDLWVVGQSVLDGDEN